MKKLFLIIALLTSVVIGCRKSGFKGDANTNKPPHTYMSADTIVRAGGNRYNTQVNIRWWGNDEDGFITGYKISFDQINWTFTKRQDSTFNLQMPLGKDTFDFHFYVKAIDNLGAEDSRSATLVLPVKNSFPTVKFLISEGSAGTITRNPVRSFPVLKYYWKAEDPDGAQDLDHVEFCLNDTNTSPFQVGATVSEITLSALNKSASVSKCNVYTGQSTTPLSQQIDGLKLGDTNILYVRAVDKVGSRSPYMASQRIFVKKVYSDILLVNAYLSSNARQQGNIFYTSNLNNAGYTKFDTLLAAEVLNNNYTELSPDNLTQSRVFALFKHIIWITDDANFTLAFGQKTTSDFFKNGGTMLMSVAFSSVFDTTQSWFDFTPVKSLVPQPPTQTFRMGNGAAITTPLAGWPSLTYSANLSIVRPVFKFENSPAYNYDYIYHGDITITGSGGGNWNSADSTNVVVKRSAGGNTNYIFSAVPFEKLNGSSNIDLFFKKALVNELKF
jgi:hypothetical protein